MIVAKVDLRRPSRGLPPFPFHLRSLPAAAALLLGVVLRGTPAAAQAERPPAPTTQERLRELEQRVAELEAGAAQEKLAKDEVEKNYSKGIISLGGFQFRLGGQIKINFVDTQNEEDPVLAPGGTDSPDPHLELQKIRIIPRVDFPKSDRLGQISLHGQIDFRPTAGDTILKEATLNHDVSPTWYIASQLKFGLDDRFIRPARLTENYPLIGTAFWRDESVAIFWEGTLGDKRGAPEGKKRSGGGGTKRKAQRTGGSMERDELQSEEGGGGAQAFDDEGEPVPSQDSRSRSTTHAPFDFGGNPGALKVHLSAGDGYTHNGRAIGRDRAAFHEVLQDDRELNPPLAMREVGAGLGYERDFREIGEIELLGFYYNDSMRDEAVAFLQENLTERDPITGAAIRGYGDSDARNMNRFGINAGYHLEAYHLMKAMGMEDTLNPRRGDGPYLFYQWIKAEDGELDRDGWYAQASWRFSNPERWRYFRSIEPVVRYFELRLHQAHIPSLPLTWNRRQWLVGAILGIVKGVYVRTEYAFNDETTGGGKVADNELLIQLLAEF